MILEKDGFERSCPPVLSLWPNQIKLSLSPNTSVSMVAFNCTSDTWAWILRGGSARTAISQVNSGWHGVRSYCSIPPTTPSVESVCIPTRNLCQASVSRVVIRISLNRQDCVIGPVSSPFFSCPELEICWWKFQTSNRVFDFSGVASTSLQPIQGPTMSYLRITQVWFYK